MALHGQDAFPGPERRDEVSGLALPLRFGMRSRLDGSKQIVYDCVMPSGATKCVTESGGIASDETAVVRLLFSNSLSGGKPTCVSS